MSALLRWLFGYTVEQWIFEERSAHGANYSYALSINQIRAHYLQGAVTIDPHWHYLVMTEYRGKTRFYFDGESWPREELKSA